MSLRRRTDWQTEKSWQLPLPAPISLFGNVGAAYDEWTSTEWRLAGRSGFAWKILSSPAAEVQVCGGPVFTCADLQQLKPPDSQLLLQLQCRCPLAGPAQLEYQGSAWSRQPTLDRDRLEQDLGLVIPVRADGKLRFGAKHQTDDATSPGPKVRNLEFYFGLGLER